jgi:hypothetical protein
MAEYHEAFWVAIAGAAPVIGLAHVLALPPLLREVVKATRATLAVREPSAGPTTSAPVASLSAWR